MELVRCLAGTGLLATVALVGALGGARPPVMAAVDPPWQPPPCGDTRAGAAGSGPAWYRLDPILDERGSLAGRRLTVGLAEAPARHLELAPESFASGPQAGIVLVGEDDGITSRLRLLDVVRGCETAVGRERAAVVRGALVAPDGATAWEHRVNRATRADEGVWRRPLAGGEAVQVLGGLPADERFGPTFVTELSLTADGRLAVASCGERICRTRVLDPATGRVAAFEGTGPLVGVLGDRAVAHAACAGLPCPIEAVDLRTGRRTVLAEHAGLAAMDGSGTGTLVIETPDGTLEAIDLGSGRRSTVAADRGLVPVRRGSAAGSGADAPPWAALLAPDGRIAGVAGARLFDPASRTTIDLGEVLR